MPKFRLDKLIRDGLPEQFRKNGQTLESHYLSPEEKLEALPKKIIEEALEIDPSKSNEENLGELADVAQAFQDTVEAYGFTIEQVEQVKQERALKVGGFATGLFAETITTSGDKNDYWTDYYRQRPDLYPEITDGEDPE